MARKTKSLNLLPQLYRKRFRLDMPMRIEENVEAWKKAREENWKKIKLWTK